MKLEIAEWFIQNFTKKGDYVFDPFFGCGTTGVACIHNGRRWGGVELIPEYKQIAEKRIKLEQDQLSLFDEEEIEMLYEQQSLF
jgi:DNA modification methylase